MPIIKRHTESSRNIISGTEPFDLEKGKRNDEDIQASDEPTSLVSDPSESSMASERCYKTVLAAVKGTPPIN